MARARLYLNEEEEDAAERVKVSNLKTSLKDPKYELTSTDFETASQSITRGFLTEEEIFIIAKNVRFAWSNPDYWPSAEEVNCAAVLATHGHLPKVEYMLLKNMELPEVPDLTKLASLVNYGVEFDNITGDVGLLLKNIQCIELSLSNMCLCDTTTSYVVQCLESKTELMVLGYHGPVSLEIQTLSRYNGKGTCVTVVYHHHNTYNMVSMFGDQLKSWAQTNNWKVEENGKYIMMECLSLNELSESERSSIYCSETDSDSIELSQNSFTTSSSYSYTKYPFITVADMGWNREPTEDLFNDFSNNTGKI